MAEIVGVVISGLAMASTLNDCVDLPAYISDHHLKGHCIGYLSTACYFLFLSNYDARNPLLLFHPHSVARALPAVDESRQTRCS
ncbi:hypothetical protein B0H67DRAFT_571780 [Lasiosphaeris hirsuta]|uniref:Uncharacterized protein n=1 Tax=Lasiosphaeris hirsuta TaxID=260670 RepID=A0AA40B1C2_9PEZI|nr:hypothetical protein B0H67DRAFT_571780 [Lasiosphaeris hirsuta]